MSMQVRAFSTPSRRGWRWRIVRFSGEMVEESIEAFGSIAAALSDGRRRVNELRDDGSPPNQPPPRGTTYPGSR
jgi:hypothetical protein